MVPSLPCVTFLSLLPSQNASGRQSGSRELPARPSFISNTPHRCIRERECPKGVASSSHESTCHGEGYCCKENNQLSYCLLGWLLVILFPLSWKKDKRFNYYFLLELFVQLLSKSIKTNQSHRNLHFVRLMAVTVEDSVRIGEKEKRNLWKGGFSDGSTAWAREKKSVWLSWYSQQPFVIISIMSLSFSFSNSVSREFKCQGVSPQGRSLWEAAEIICLTEVEGL